MQIITWGTGLVTSVADTEKDVRMKISAHLYQLVNQYDFYKQLQLLLWHYIGICTRESKQKGKNKYMEKLR